MVREDGTEVGALRTCDAGACSTFRNVDEIASVEQANKIKATSCTRSAAAPLVKDIVRIEVRFPICLMFFSRFIARSVNQPRKVMPCAIRKSFGSRRVTGEVVTVFRGKT